MRANAGYVVWSGDIKDLKVGITQSPHSAAQFEVCFDSLFDAGGALAFPCDGAGRVDLDTISEHERNKYFYARAMRGWRYVATPRVVPRVELDGGIGGSHRA
ncbi:MAG TPA: hypothetical protein VGQ19_06700 [Burkholderiales bacterium]|jgi:hypothetical protein|nr:hypothetical protein [Burkholderiales bacterium]